MIPSPNYENRSGSRVRLVVVHTSEGARDVGSLGHYLQNPAVQASYHAAFDDQRAEQFVDYSKAAWAVLSANSISDNGCCCGFAAWSRTEWLTNHPTMLELAAQWVAARCTARSVPIRHLSTAEVAACKVNANHPGGVIGHWDWTVGAQDGTHTDPGTQFPWDWVINRAQQIAGNGQGPKHRERTNMIRLPATGVPTDPKSSPLTWLQRNFDIPWNVVGGWEGNAAFSFGVQDWNSGRADAVRGLLLLASWMMPGGKLIPVDPIFTVAGMGQALAAHTLTKEYPAPAGCVGVTLNYAAPGEAYVAIGRSG